MGEGLLDLSRDPETFSLRTFASSYKSDSELDPPVDVLIDHD